MEAFRNKGRRFEMSEDICLEKKTNFEKKLQKAYYFYPLRSDNVLFFEVFEDISTNLH